MRSGTYILLVLLILFPAVNAATINTVGGDTSNGGVATITGSGFGTNPLDIEWTKDKIESSSIGTKIQHKNDYDGSQFTDWFTYTIGAGDEPRISTQRAYSGTKSIDSSVTINPAGFQRPVIHQKLSTFDKMYVTFWIYYKPLIGSSNTQWKFWRINDCDSGGIACTSYVSDNCGDVYQFVYSSLTGPNYNGLTLHCGVDGAYPYPQPRTCWENVVPTPFYLPQDGNPEGYGYLPPPRTDSRPGVTYTDLSPTFGGWTRVELYVDANSVDQPNGYFMENLYKPGDAKYKVAEFDNVLYQYSSCPRDATRPWTTFVLQGFFDDNGASFTGESAEIFYDDITIQYGTQARVEICDNSNWDLATKCEVQKPTLWNDNGITFETNYGGSFNPNDPAWLFVIDDSGTVSEGEPITLGSGVVSDSLIYFNSMSSANTLWQPEISVSNYGTQSQAVKNSGLGYVSSLYGTGTRFGPNPLWNGDFWVQGNNFDFFDPEQDGGRVDIILRWDQDPQGPDSNTWIGFDPYTLNGQRNVNFEMTASNPRFPMLMFGSSDPYDRTTYNQFRANVGSNPVWTAINQGEWHTYSYVWRNNGGLHKDQAHIFIDGHLMVSDFSGNLPNVGEMNAFAFGAAEGTKNVAFTLDEIYSFDSWDVTGINGNFAQLVWPEEIMLHYPNNNAGQPDYLAPVSHTNMPEYQFQIQNNQESITSCNLYVDNNLIQTINNIQNLDHVEVIPTLALSNGDHTWRVTCDGGRLVSPTYTFRVDFAQPTTPTVYGITGTPNNGESITINGALLGTHTNQIEWLGGINGALEGMPVGTRLEHYSLSPDPDWNAPGWVGGESVNDYSTPRITTENAHSGVISLRHEAFGEHGPASWVSTSAYQPVRDIADPSMPDVFSETFASAWIYFNPLGNDGNDTSQWKIMNIQHRMGGNIAEGNFWLETTWDDTFNVWDGIPHFYAVDENRGLCSYPCSTSSLSCKNCAYPGPPISSSDAESYYWASKDSYGSTTPPPYEAFKWMRIDWWVEASSEFDTWDGNMYYRLFIPSSNTSYQYRLNNIATHGSDPLLDSGESLYPPYWDLVFDTVQWKNQISHGYGEAIIYIDDNYIQLNTPARIEICNNQDYYAATHCELQKPNYWSENNIQFEMNFGSFTADSNVYLFVITEDNVVTNTLPITLGSSTSTGTCSDGIQNQGETDVDCGGPCAACAACTDGVDTRECSFSTQGCLGYNECIGGQYTNICIDADPNDFCPIIGESIILQNGQDIPEIGIYSGQTESVIANGWDCEFCDVIQTKDQEIKGFKSSFVKKKLLHFDLSMIPQNRTVTQAVLTMVEDYNPSSASRVSISRVLKPWSASSTTYRCTMDPEQDGCETNLQWSALGLGNGGTNINNPDKEYVTEITANTGTNNWDITQAVQNIINNPQENYGFLLEELDNTQNQWFVSGQETPITSRPKLTITFAGGSCSATILGAEDRTSHSLGSLLCDGVDNDCNGIIDEYCYGDVNGDSIRNVVDLTLQASSFRITDQDTSWNAHLDTFEDGIINIKDLITTVTSFGNEHLPEFYEQPLPQS